MILTNLSDSSGVYPRSFVCLFQFNDEVNTALLWIRKHLNITIYANREILSGIVYIRDSFLHFASIKDILRFQGKCLNETFLFVRIHSGKPNAPQSKPATLLDAD